MPSIFKISKENINDPKEWFREKWDFDFDEDGFSDKDDYYYFEDLSEEFFQYIDTDEWINMADGAHLIYGFYSEDSLNAEFIEIKDSICLREYRTYFDDGFENVDMGENPEFNNWVDVATWIDDNLY